VRQHDLRDSAVASLRGTEDPAQVPLVIRPGSTTSTALEPGSAMIHVFVPSRVIGDGLGASTQYARPVPDPSISTSQDASSEPGDGRALFRAPELARQKG